MKARFVSFFITGMIIAGTYASAQEEGVKFGMGISWNTASVIGAAGDESVFFLPVGFTNYYFPIQFGSRFRLEPEFGIFSLSNSQTDSLFSSGTSKQENSMSFIRIGTGIFYTAQTSASSRIYVGPRLGVLLASDESTSSFPSNTTQERSQTIFFAGACLGAEYLFSPNFLIGGEFQLNYLNYGEETRTPARTFPKDASQTVITNNALIFGRFFF